MQEQERIEALTTENSQQHQEIIRLTRLIASLKRQLDRKGLPGTPQSERAAAPSIYRVRVDAEILAMTEREAMSAISDALTKGMPDGVFSQSLEITLKGSREC